MHLVAAGLNHRTAPLDLRELVVVTDSALPGALRDLVADPAVAEAVILSTCNRTELYAVLADPSSLFAEEILTAFLARIGGAAASRFAGHTYYYRDERAAEHLMRVSSGIDSMILGENQILGQVKRAYEVAREASSAGALLNNLFQAALSVGKRVRTQTKVGHGAFSVGSAAVELASRIFSESLEGKTVLVLGAGKMSELTARHLQAHGAPSVFVTNRTFGRAQSLARQLGSGASARHYDELPDSLLLSDIVICSTAAPHPVVTRDLISAAMRARRNRPLFLVDIAVPRDVDPAVGNMPNVYLYNIDDLSEIVERDRAKRQTEVIRAEEMIAGEVEVYHAWRRSVDVVPLVTAVRDRLTRLRDNEMATIRARLPQLTDRELRIIETSLQSITGKIAHDAIMTIKESAINAGKSDADRLDAIRCALGVASGEETSGPSEARKDPANMQAALPAPSGIEKAIKPA